MKLALVSVPVTDVDRAEDFYTAKLGFQADIDRTIPDGRRFCQLTPPGSACSIAIGKGSSACAGTPRGLRWPFTGCRGGPTADSSIG